ncbi:hypothetical protein FHR81_002539 [Actinoalloteichus hoggarensis]|uniref:Uncharacterized protein n=1 Tax=Actinoalloteichus hoggarensis TaxID=1470176 RepID=A0A221VXA6_9PSEU|nr:hypothetical protein [Actinoalloteichus hoggarensis]ASO18143.1 hypothetical protein AHOG_02395 [Actinoalloteichus hoggarensis]MBB5921499.1 hypothetical protein [Actinoalloteichus hoggarensis]
MTDAAGGFGARLKNTSPAGRVLIGVALLLALLAVGAYLLGSLGGTRLQGTTNAVDAANVTPYQWDSAEDLHVTSTAQGVGSNCTVEPADGGEVRDLTVPANPQSSNPGRSRASLVQAPWFEGTAEVSCQQSVLIRSGFVAAVSDATGSRSFITTAAIVVAIPFLAGLFVGRRRTTGGQAA